MRGVTRRPARRTPVAGARPLLRDQATEALRRYLAELDGAECADLHELVLAEVERPLLEIVLEHARGNQSRAARLLGLNRATLRRKLRKYGLDF